MRVDGKKRRSAALLSRLAAVYGLPAGRPRDYEEAVGLLLNEGMALRVKALSALAAGDAADGFLDDAWAGAFSAVEEEGAEALARINEARAVEAARRGGGGWR